MTLSIGLTLGILAIAILLFVTEWLRTDIVALLVLVVLALLRLVTPTEALSGFSNPAVVTVWAIFVVSGGLSRTGVANLLGGRILRLAGQSEVRLIVVIMATAVAMSAFMNNVGVTALLLPVVISIARRTGRHPSRLLMPLAFASLLGGMMTLIGTPPNILASDVMRDAGLPPLRFFDFLPGGAAASIVGILYIAWFGRHLLPNPQSRPDIGGRNQAEIEQAYLMRERLSRIRIPANSPLIGRSLSDSRLSAALGLTVLDVSRTGDLHIKPERGTQLKAGDLLTVSGRLDTLDEVRGREYLVIGDQALTIANLVTEDIDLAEARVAPNSGLVNRNLRQLDFRQKYGVIVLALWRDGKPLPAGFDNVSLEVDDLLLLQGPKTRLQELRGMSQFIFPEQGEALAFGLKEELLEVVIPADSPLVGKRLVESHLAEFAGLAVLGLVRDGEVRLMVDPGATILQAGDRLYVKGNARANLEALRAFQDLKVEDFQAPSLRDLETDRTGMLEVVFSPRSTIPGNTLGQINFRNRYDLNVIAIFREGRAYRTNVGGFTLRFGDALLLHGSREKLAMIAKDHNFISLADDVQPLPNLAKAPMAIAILVGMVLVVLFGWVSISIASVAAGLLMVLTGCLTMDEAYRDIEWRAVFLIAGMLPLGIAMQTSGTAALLAQEVTRLIGGSGGLVMVIGLYIVTVLAAQIIPSAVVVVLMAPIALSASANLGLSPVAIMLVVALAASVCFLSPVGHPSNLLVMAPGGYRFKDYVKVGFPLAVLLLLVCLFVLPLFWPFY